MATAAIHSRDATGMKVSFREDVVFSPEDTKALSTRSGISHSSYGSGDSPSSSTNKFSKLRSGLIREQTNRDPFFSYQVTRHLGAGSMGDVKLVKKRADKVGGSARRDIQEAVRRQKREKECLRMPVVGSIFQFCVDGDLKVDDGSASHHSFLSITKAVGEDRTVSTTSRSFEDSLLNGLGGASPDNNNNNNSHEIIYAMKSIHLNQVHRKEIVDELRNEIAILKDLDHPNIVRAIETFEFNGKISIVMEVCSGGDLFARDPYTEPEAARIVSSVLSAIAYMHSRQIVHRDLKFENILWANTSPMSEIKLIDFGLSKVYVDHNKKLTDACGTIYTMAPEVILGQHTEKADMWSIGVVAFMLLASALPFHGKGQTEVMRRIVNNSYAFDGRRWKRISPQAKDFIRQLLVSDPDHRANAERALASEWLTLQSAPTGTERALRPEEEKMVVASMQRYSGYPKLQKMALMVVAHKSSSEEIGALRKQFQKYNSRHDGSIWFDEFCKAMSEYNHSNEELRCIFDAMDLAGSGKVRYTEFIAATIEAHGAISEARLAEAFDRLDCDDSGYITADDLREILGDGLSREEIDAIIAEADLTKDKTVSYSEYLALWEGKHETNKAENPKALQSEFTSFRSEMDASDMEAADARNAFLQEKNLQNTLHTWSLEMQLPTQEFAKGCSFLHVVALGNLSDVEVVLEERPTLSLFRDYDRRTALHIAAAEGHVDICAYLIKKGARVNRSDRWGGFPLDDAHRHGCSDVVNLLRKQGAKFGNTSQTVNLITAASQGNVEEVRTLLEFGSMDLNQGDYDHRRALHLAANEGHLEVVKVLCEAGADVNVKDRWGDRPLDDARKAKKNASAIVKVLSGAVVVPSPDQQSARMHDLSAQQRATLKPAESQDEGMTQLPVQEFAMGCSVLHQAALGNQVVLEMIFLEQPALIHFRDYDRRSALHIAASEGHEGICQYLVMKGARINRVDRWGGSPLDDAHRHKHADVVKFLRENGAKFGSTSQVTNFITSASEGDVEEVQSFLEFGSVEIDVGDYDKRTALHLAVGEGHLEIVKLLCQAGANVNVEDRWRHRPLDDARYTKKNSADIMKVLLEHGAKSTKISTMMRTALLKLMGR
ncbi:MAP kinase-activated protein kinase 2 (Fragment) [Seminavis robusta]|uniref:MAP kinase-activated protein kinase 2 n=1 Tax=Seminavis robusta TaxID=568900 RepID=A0A9N8HBL5_9STRA